MMVYYAPVVTNAAATLIFENRKLEIKENYNVTRLTSFILLSVYGRTMDALASGGDEGRNRLR